MKSKSISTSKNVKIGKHQDEILTDTMDNKNHNTMYDVDFGDVQGQELGKRAMLISAAGHHHCIMIGPPGGGKTMMAERLPTILPPMTWNETVSYTHLRCSYLSWSCYNWCNDFLLAICE